MDEAIRFIKLCPTTLFSGQSSAVGCLKNLTVDDGQPTNDCRRQTKDLNSQPSAVSIQKNISLASGFSNHYSLTTNYFIKTEILLWHTQKN